jgi:hypothetical protein
MLTRKELEALKADLERRLRQSFRHLSNREWCLKCLQDVTRELARQD